jgi:hypothetical protein
MVVRIWQAHEMDSIDLDGFTCPRCSQTVGEDWYGPCASCRAELQATYAGEARVVEAAAYEPKMNVTPNAVALKD